MTTPNSHTESPTSNTNSTLALSVSKRDQLVQVAAYIRAEEIAKLHNGKATDKLMRKGFEMLVKDRTFYDDNKLLNFVSSKLNPGQGYLPFDTLSETEAFRKAYYASDSVSPHFVEKSIRKQSLAEVLGVVTFKQGKFYITENTAGRKDLSGNTLPDTRETEIIPRDEKDKRQLFRLILDSQKAKNRGKPEPLSIIGAVVDSVPDPSGNPKITSYVLSGHRPQSLKDYNFNRDLENQREEERRRFMSGRGSFHDLT